MANHPNRAKNKYLLVFGDSQNDYVPLEHSGSLIGARRKAEKHAASLGTKYDIKREYDGRWERIGDVGDY